MLRPGLVLVIVVLAVSMVAEADLTDGHCSKNYGEGCENEIHHSNWNSDSIAGTCSPKDSCTSAGGHCVKGPKDCDGTLDPTGCIGKRCKCCIPDDQEEEDDDPSSWPWTDPDLGSLDVTDDWYKWKCFSRTNALPYSRERIDTRFYIHTRERRNVDTNHRVLARQSSSLDGTGFDATKSTKFITHGFMNTGNNDWLKEMAEELLDHGDYNVFRVDWGGGSGKFLHNYGQAVSNTRVVGLEIAYLVNWLVQNYNLDPANVHLIGHSLGAHISGYAGEAIPGLGRISGLDPAGPSFSNMPSFVRLDETDAMFVDNYHTDAAYIPPLGGYGTTQAMGHVDFYPNGGGGQKGCNVIGKIGRLANPFNNKDRLVGCSHSYAYELYMDTLEDPDKYTAMECSSWRAYKWSMCGSCDDDESKCSPVGIRASEYAQRDRVNVAMYFKTD